MKEKAYAIAQALEQFWSNLKQFWSNLEQFWSNKEKAEAIDEWLNDLVDNNWITFSIIYLGILVFFALFIICYIYIYKPNYEGGKKFKRRRKK